MPRIVGVDFCRGLGIFCMILVNSFVKDIAQNNMNAIISYISTTYNIMNAVLAIPVLILNQFGSLFMFLTGISVTLSVLSVIRKKKMNIGRYLLSRLLFGILIRFFECLCSAITENSDIFNSNQLEFFSIPLSEFAGPLDAIAWIGFLIPLILVIFMYIPIFNKQWKIHILLLYIIFIIWIILIPYINMAAENGSNYMKSYKFYFISHLLKKIYYGNSMISLYFPYGIYGSIWGILITNINNWKVYGWFGILNALGFLIIGCCSLFTTIPISQLIQQIVSENKPIGFHLICYFIITILFLFIFYMMDSPRKLDLLLKTRTNSLFIRKYSCISLSVYYLEPFISKYLLRIFEYFFGNGYDSNAEEIQWNPFIILLFMIINSILWFLWIYCWEKYTYRFSFENQICILSQWFIHNRTSKNDYSLILYEPIHEIQKIIELKKKDLEENENQSSGLPMTILSSSLHDVITTPMAFQGLDIHNVSNSNIKNHTIEDEVVLFEPQVIVDEKELNQS